MKKTKILITLLFTLTVFLTSSTETNAQEKEYSIFYEGTSPIWDDEFYNGDTHILKKGYYIFKADGDVYSFEFTNQIESFIYQGDGFSLSDYESHFTVEEKYKEPLSTAINHLNNPDYDYEQNVYLLIKANSYGIMAYEGEQGCYASVLYGVETMKIDQSSTTGEKSHVINVNSTPSLEKILEKYTFSDNVDSTSQLTLDYLTNYDGRPICGNYPIYIEVTDIAGNSTSTLDYIRVHDFDAPIITTDKDVYKYEVHTNLTSDDIKNLFNITDNYNIPLGIKKEYDENFNDQNNILGTYTFTCKATDSTGNSSSKTISILIVDETNPSIELKDGGDKVITNHELSIQEIYDLLIIEDNYDTFDLEDIEITTNCDGLQGVEYQINVKVVDSSNNQTTKTFIYYINDTTPPSITVKDTIYLDKSHTYTTEELLVILKNAGLISDDAVSVNLIEQELTDSTKEEDIYKVTIEEILSNGEKKYTSATFKYKKEPKTNIVPLIIIPSIILIGSVSAILIVKRKRHARSNNIN